VLGPVLAALYKKETMTLNVGFRDETGLLQTPCFKIADGRYATGTDSSSRD
jgi:hypothetical protein